MLHNSDLQRLIKIEDRIQQIIKEDLDLYTYPIEFDIIPPQKMIEIMSYRIPSNISNWKYGRDYERQRTIYEYNGHLPFEVVINSNPARAYLMNSNKFSIQCLVIAHVYGHVSFFSNNQYFKNSRQDIMDIMYEASKRFNEYEKRYGISEVEKIIDAGHALQFHSSPFESNETDEEKRRRIFRQTKKKIHTKGGEFKDLLGSSKSIDEDIELYNQNLWRNLKRQIPIEPTEDILGFLINNASLEDWQLDILETLRLEGQYFWPIMKTQQMNEGWATVIHEKVMEKLFNEELLTHSEHADFAYTNSLVKANSIGKLNPYLIGSCMWRDIENRWNKGQYGDNWNNCKIIKEKDEWDLDLGDGWNKCKETMESYFDWFFMNDFLTIDLIKDLNLFLFEAVETLTTIDYTVTKDDAEKIREYIINLFSRAMMPTVEIVDGKNDLILVHKRINDIPLDGKYTEETLRHIAYLWEGTVKLISEDDEWEISYDKGDE